MQVKEKLIKSKLKVIYLPTTPPTNRELNY